MAQQITEALFMQIGRKRYQVASLQEASERFSAARDAFFSRCAGQRASAIPQAVIVNDRGETVARISLNGRVWSAAKWLPGQTPLYDNIPRG